ncbi:MAG: hypothetical protein EOO77_31060, partial [Oxalobacteraceae bacterium]
MTQTYPLVSQGFATCRVIPFINILHRTGQDPGFVGLGSHLAQLSGPGNIETAPLRNFTGTERAAVLMMLVGEEEAATILQKLDPEEVRNLGKAMFAVADVSEAEVEQVLDDFTYKARERTGVQFDPSPRIHGIMNRALGTERAESVLARITPAEAGAGLEMLAWFEPEEIAKMVETEHPQIAAVLLVNLDPEIAAKVF